MSIWLKLKKAVGIAPAGARTDKEIKAAGERATAEIMERQAERIRGGQDKLAAMISRRAERLTKPDD